MNQLDVSSTIITNQVATGTVHLITLAHTVISDYSLLPTTMKLSLTHLHILEHLTLTNRTPNNY